MSDIQNIPTAQIIPGDNDRQHFDPIALEELADSIREHGLAQPITVRPVWVCSVCHTTSTDFGERCDHCHNDEFHNWYQIVAGERRFRAISTILHWDTIPAIVRELDDEAASAIMLAENTSRADLNPIEEAQAYHKRVQQFGWAYEQVAKVAGVSPNLVKRRISLLELVDEAQHLIAFGNFPIGHAELLTDLDHNRQRIAIRIFRESENTLTLKAFRHIASELLEAQSQDSLFDLENFWVEQVIEMKELPRRGKRAVTGAPTRKDLPPVHVQPRDTSAVIIDRYIADLLANGHQQAAAAIGNVYNAMVHTNYMAVPAQARLV